MKKCNALRWLRTMIALLVVLSMVLCGCAEAGTDGGDGGKDQGQANTLFGDGDGKLEAQDAVDSLTNIYGALLGAVGGNQSGSYGYEMDLVVTLGDMLRQQLGEAMAQMELGADTSWFKNVGIHMEMASKDDLVQMAVDAQLNGETLLSVETVMDIMAGMVYVSVPELNQQAIGVEVDVSEMQGAMQAGTQLMGEYAAMAKDLPTDQELNAVLTRYLNVVLENLNEPVSGKEQLSTGGITMETDSATYSFTTHNLMDIISVVLTTAKSDGELEKLLDAFSKVVNEVGAKQAAEQNYTWTDVDLHEQMMEAIDPALEDIQESKENTENMEVAMLVLYTAGGELVGGKLAVDAVEMKLYSLKDGKNTAFLMDMAGSMQLAGTGKVSGSKVSGEYALSAMGQEMLYIEVKDFDTKAFAKGELDCTLRLRLGEAMLDNMGSNMFISEDTVIELVLDADQKSAKIGVNLYADTVLLFGISLSSKTTSGGKAKVPSNYADAMDSSAMEAWAKNLKFDSVISNLRSAGVPNKIVDMLEQALEQAMNGGSAYPGGSVYPGYGY